MSNLQLAVDLDDTLLDLTGEVCRWLNAREAAGGASTHSPSPHGIIKPSDILGWDGKVADRFWGGNTGGYVKEDFWDAYHDLRKTGAYWDAHPNDTTAVWSCNELVADGHTLSILSSKEAEEHANVRAWLEREGFNLNGDIILVPDSMSKVQYATRFDMFVDDNPNLIEPLSELDKRFALMDRPWNHAHHLKRRQMRVYGWYNVRDLVRWV